MVKFLKLFLFGGIAILLFLFLNNTFNSCHSSSVNVQLIIKSLIKNSDTTYVFVNGQDSITEKKPSNTFEREIISLYLDLKKSKNLKHLETDTISVDALSFIGKYCDYMQARKVSLK